MYSIRKGIVFDNLDVNLQESLRNLGFKEGDNISEIFQDFLDKRHISLDEYISDFYYMDLDYSISKSFKLSATAMTLNKATEIKSYIQAKEVQKNQEKYSKKEERILKGLNYINKFGGEKNVRFAV